MIFVGLSATVERAVQFGCLGETLWSVYQRELVQGLELRFEFAEVGVAFFNGLWRQVLEGILRRNLFEQTIFGHFFVAGKSETQI